MELERTGALEGSSVLTLPEPRLRPLFAMARYADEPDPQLFEGEELRG